MAIKISGTTVIDDSRDINNVGIITATNLLVSSNVGIGTDNPDTLLTLYSDTEDEELLHFDMGSPENRRGWKFEQLNTSTSTGLKLKANVNSKPFEIHSSTDVVHFKVHTHETTGSVQIPVKVGIADSIYHIGDDDTLIRFPAANTFSAETAGSERFRITSTGAICFGNTDNSAAGYGQAGWVLTSNADAPPTWQDSGGGGGGVSEALAIAYAIAL
jgi:hypothetical protein